jgi:hypothetical protein
MGRDDNRVILVGERSEESLPAMQKREVARRVLDWVTERLSRNTAPPKKRRRERPRAGRRGNR